MNRSLPFAGLLLAAVVGCGPTTRDYSATIHNESSDAYTVLMIKDGMPMENGWLPPEDLASLVRPPPDWSIHRGVLPPGKTVDVKQTGDFYDSTSAIIRAYRGDLTFEQMLGVGPDSPNRSDVVLIPGRHNNIVIGADGKANRR